MKDPHHPRLLAAIPCFNEADHIGSLVSQAQQFVDLVVVVDDGSSDATARVAAGSGAMVLSHPQNLGKGAALNTAFQRARELDGEILVTLDGDGQHDPSQIPLLLGPIQRGEAEVVVGSRFLKARNSIPGYRILGQRVLTVANNLFSGKRLTDSQSGFRAFSRQAMESLYFKEQGLAVESEMQFLFAKRRLRVAEVPITVHYSGQARRNPFRHGFGVLFRVPALAAHHRPLRLFVILGGIVLHLAGLSGVKTWSTLNSDGFLHQGWLWATILLLTAGLGTLLAGVALNATAGRNRLKSR